MAHETGGDESARLSKLHPELRPYACDPKGVDSIRIIVRFAGPLERLTPPEFSPTAWPAPSQSVFNFTGAHNMTRVYMQLAFGEVVDLADTYDPGLG